MHRSIRPAAFLTRPWTALLIVAFLLIAHAPRAAAQQATATPEDSLGWHRQAVGQLNFTNVAFDNWSQGGENSLAWQLTMSSSFEDVRPRFVWGSSAKLGYGRSKLGSSDFRKSIDEIRLESVLKLRTKGPLAPFVSALLLTQFSTGYAYTDSARTAISGFFDPGYLTESLGVSYQSSPVFKELLGGAVKETFTRNYPVYADNPATPTVEKTRVEGGVSSETDLNLKYHKNMILTSQLNLFSNLKGISEVDVNWDTTLTLQVAKYVNVNFDTRLVYDRTVSARRQLKQSLAIGLNYALFGNQ